MYTTLYLNVDLPVGPSKIDHSKSSRKSMKKISIYILNNFSCIFCFYQ